jgi:hypothetical protein
MCGGWKKSGGRQAGRTTRASGNRHQYGGGDDQDAGHGIQIGAWKHLSTPPGHFMAEMLHAKLDSSGFMQML